MAITKPSISVIFKTIAQTFANRVNSKNIILIVKDDTLKTFSTKVYKELSEVNADSASYTADNLQAIKDCFVSNPTKVTAIRIDATDGVIADALTIASTLESSYIGVYSNVQADHTALADWSKVQEESKKFYNAICFNLSAPADSRHVINLTNPKVVFADSTRGEVTGDKYIPSLLGYIAGRDASSQSPTYMVLDNLASVTEVADSDTAINNGQLVLFNDEGQVRIIAGINNKVTVEADENEQMKYIEYSESMDTIYTDIYNTYKNYYLSKYKNFNDHREILVAAINTYFSNLVDDEILDPDGDNKASQNVDAMRKFLRDNNVDNVDTMTDAVVKNQNFGKKVFIRGNIRIAESMQDLEMENILN